MREVECYHDGNIVTLRVATKAGPVSIDVNTVTGTVVTDLGVFANFSSGKLKGPRIWIEPRKKGKPERKGWKLLVHRSDGDPELLVRIPEPSSSEKIEVEEI